jgi:hypothetical protein
MILPTIIKGSDSQLVKKQKSSRNNQSSQRNQSHPKKNSKQRYYTEGQDYIGKKLLNYIGFDRVKSLKSSTQQCQDSLKKYQEEKKELH